jgi:rare lipoprotein A (peptidoglycan hydrolase)
MKYKLIILLLFLTSCAQNYSRLDLNKSFNSKGFAYIYNEKDFIDKVIKRKLDNNSLQIAHNKLRPGSLIKIINIKTNDSIILKNSKRFQYPEFYKIVITKPVADEINLKTDLPLVEVIEVKKNKSFVAKKTKIFKEEEKIHSNAPVETVIINNISKKQKVKNKAIKDKFYIIIAEFYSKNSASLLKKRITQELKNFDSKKLYINSKKSNKITLLSGPYSSINLMKNDYIQLKNFGFEELNISINE